MSQGRAKPLLLWDIDGTLIRNSRPAVDAFYAALKQVYQISEVGPLNTPGKTDSQIVREALTALHFEPARIDAGLADFQRVYVGECRQRFVQLQQSVVVLDGVCAALARLESSATHALLTGNLEPTARLKLEAAGLAHWFAWERSAFGSDHEQRNELVAIARQRHTATQAYSGPLIVIGDTPNDIACARAGGAAVLAVATGRFSLDELAACQPDALLPSLADTAAVCAQIEQLHAQALCS